jgi:hypothetical protein
MSRGAFGKGWEQGWGRKKGKPSRRGEGGGYPARLFLKGKKGYSAKVVNTQTIFTHMNRMEIIGVKLKTSMTAEPCAGSATDALKRGLNFFQ